ncbi:class I SAM-dependent methyltransferase [Gilvimarinus agarilyticus]|uniref:class I SAM-dependent methyltransferase n=1 Tax=Gilvimarinus sp. 2_MG-2023 TaxID=3062666 RepID=UPI001C08A198|nr:class I SAM-dependent methyltransferase [Gilvimarinus sp. 2_MG-2023]MBU2884403.1 class I SAM-dependent methyltransferase [Gilvimarinus agarilyticus]MDO6569539.1 class I SAM-dependent methyltransferase [Gilvimarinus sp. 2_MG-2023]
MNPVDIGKAYDQITHLWQSEKFNLLNGIEPHKKAVSFVKTTGTALDIGCGCTGRFIDLLLAEGFTPEGVDISAKKISLAQKKHPELTFYHKDICTWAIPRKYDFITAWDSLWHIPLNEQRRVLTKIVESLNKGGVFIFSFGGTDEPDDHTDSFMGPEVYYSTLGTSGFLSVLMELGCICKHLEFDQHPEFHAYIIVQKA